MTITVSFGVGRRMVYFWSQFYEYDIGRLKQASQYIAKQVNSNAAPSSSATKADTYWLPPLQRLRTT